MAEAMGVDTSALAHGDLRPRRPARLRLGLAVCAHAALRESDPFGLHIGIEYLFMAVVGGAGTSGARSWGAGVITVLKQWLQDCCPSSSARPATSR
jgi:ABC-type branched-subunit amino acid transport system permease subunit